jgi:transcriptional regulator with XRE-family HTH domain
MTAEPDGHLPAVIDGAWSRTRSDPSALRWLIGVELAAFRKRSGMSLAEVAKATGVGRPKIGYMETGRYRQYPDDVATLLHAYGASEHDVNRLASLAGRTEEKTWWAPWSDVVPDWFRTFVGLEGLAEREFVFHPLVIPGLVQIEAYAAALTQASPRVRPDHTERMVSFRMARASRLYEERPMRLHAVIGLAALELDIGDETSRLEQLERLVRLAELPNVTIQILRPDDGPHAGMSGPFTLLDFAEVRSIGYVELQDGAFYVQDPDDVHRYRMTSDNLCRTALSSSDSQRLIRFMIGSS